LTIGQARSEAPNEELEWFKDLPVKQLERARLARRINRMGRLTLLSCLGMNVISDVHKYLVRSVVDTGEQAEQLKQDYEGDMPAEIEAMSQSLTDVPEKIPINRGLKPSFFASS
jgi:hypothetical protein